MQESEWKKDISGNKFVSFKKEGVDPISGVRSTFHRTLITFEPRATKIEVREYTSRDRRLRRLLKENYSDTGTLESGEYSVSNIPMPYVFSRISVHEFGSNSRSLYLGLSMPRSYLGGMSVDYDREGNAAEFQININDRIATNQTQKANPAEEMSKKTFEENLYDLERMYRFDGEDIFYEHYKLLLGNHYTDEVRRREETEHSEMLELLRYDFPPEMMDWQLELNSVRRSVQNTLGSLMNSKQQASVIAHLFNSARNKYRMNEMDALGRKVTVDQAQIRQWIEEGLRNTLESNYAKMTMGDRFKITFNPKTLGWIGYTIDASIPDSPMSILSPQRIMQGEAVIGEPLKIDNYTYELGHKGENYILIVKRNSTDPNIPAFQFTFSRTVNIDQIKSVIKTSEGIDWRKAFSLAPLEYIQF